MCYFHIELNFTDTKILTVLDVGKLPPFTRFLGSTYPARICELTLQLPPPVGYNLQNGPESRDGRNYQNAVSESRANNAQCTSQIFRFCSR